MRNELKKKRRKKTMRPLSSLSSYLCVKIVVERKEGRKEKAASFLSFSILSVDFMAATREDVRSEN